jgi:signal transduction histidine kinase
LREGWDAQPDASRAAVDRALDNARAAVEELRELASGIHPAVLSQRGLDAALESLATRAPLPVELDLGLSQRLPSAVETAAYFVVAEALTNVAKYAAATHARVAVRRENGAAVVEISDDGVGGADAAAGTGLRGLGDRVGALDGTIELDSRPGAGTRLRARIPL